MTDKKLPQPEDWTDEDFTDPLLDKLDKLNEDLSDIIAKQEEDKRKSSILWPRTVRLLRSIADGWAHYIVWYLHMTLLFWGALWLIDIPVGFWACFGGVLFVRQLRNLLAVPADKHLKTEKK
jgi:hypothetical protein